MSVHFFYDLDGTLVDTHRATKMAYGKAGIKMPDDAWGRPWREWCPEDVHREKQRLYPNFLLEYVRVLPAAALFRITGGEIITGASTPSVRAVESVLRMLLPTSLVEASADMKIEFMANRLGQDLSHGGVLVDDDYAFGQKALDALGDSLRFVHVTEFDGNYRVYEKSGRVTRLVVQPLVMG